MNRRDFLRRCAALGASLPVFSVFGGCNGVPQSLLSDLDVNFEGDVLVIGAGAAGLAAGYLLERYGIAFEILEAGPRIGGRVKALEGFADFPIDLGAEWIHEDPIVLAELLDDPDAVGTIDVVPYSPDSLAFGTVDGVTRFDGGSNYYSEYKFRRSTWFSFLDEHIAPNIRDRIRLSTPVVSIDTSGDRVVVTDGDGQTRTADRVILTVPIKVLQDGLITFTPPLPTAKLAAIDDVHLPPGIKVFLEFDEAFYPDITLAENMSADKIYYNAAFRKDSARNVLGLFWVGDGASALTELDDDDAILEAVLADLDALFDGRATPAFIKGVVQNWAKETYIRGAYSYDYARDADAVIAGLNKPVDGVLYFAGEATSYDNTATVPGAMQSAYATVKRVLAGR